MEFSFLEDYFIFFYWKFFGVNASSRLTKKCGMGGPIYGPTDGSRRGAFWNELNLIAHQWDKLWVLDGDFNVIKFSEERNVGCTVFASLRDFSQWIRSHDLVDLSLGGASFTRSNKQEHPIMS